MTKFESSHIVSSGISRCKSSHNTRLSVLLTVPIANALFCSALFLYAVSYLIGSVNASTLFGISLNVMSLAFQLCALVLLSFKIILQKYSHLAVLSMLSLVVICGISISANSALQVTWLVLFAVCAQNLSWRSIAKSVLAATLLIILVVVTLHFFGIVEAVTMVRDGRFRTSLGFAHPNNFGQVVFIAFSAAASLSFKKRGRLLIVAGIATAAVLGISNSRTAALGIVMLSMLSCLSDTSRMLGLLQKIAAVAFLALLSLSFLLPILWNRNPAQLEAINELLSGRIYYSSYYLLEYPPKLFGYNFSGITRLLSASGQYAVDTVIMLDNAYCRLLIQYGIIPFFLFCCFYLRAISISIGAAPQLCGLLTYALLGFSECSMLYPACNFYLIAAGALLLSRLNAESNNFSAVTTHTRSLAGHFHYYRGIHD